MTEGGVILKDDMDRIVRVFFLPDRPEDQKQLDPITEDAEFEVLQPKMLEQPSKPE